MRPAYTRSEFVLAVNIAAVLGWLACAVPMCILSGWGAVSILPYVAVIGLPIAFLSCWLIAAPILRIVMNRPISWARAALWGATISAIIALVSIAIGRYRGWRQSQDDTFHSQMGGGDFIRSVDGILTAYGWQQLAQNSAMFIGLGVAIALVLRALIGPGRGE